MLWFVNMELLESVVFKWLFCWWYVLVILLVLLLLLFIIVMVGLMYDVWIFCNCVVVMLVIDVLQLMCVIDVEFSWMVVVQEVVKQFVDELILGINLGLIVYVGMVMVLVLLMINWEVIKNVLDKLQFVDCIVIGEVIFIVLQVIVMVGVVIGGGDMLLLVCIVLFFDGKEMMLINLDNFKGVYIVVCIVKDQGVLILMILFGILYGFVEINDQC